MTKQKIFQPSRTESRTDGTLPEAKVTGEKSVSSLLFSAVPRVEEANMETEAENRIALAGIIVEDPAAANEVNRILHDFSQWIVGRMGIPYCSRGVSIISVVLDAPQPVLSSLSGKLGMVDGVSVKTICSKANK